VALLAELLSLPTAGRYPALDVSPQRKKQRTFEALIGQVRRLAERLPLLMVFEDIHWLDASSRDLLDRVIENVAGWPVLLVATFRPEFQPPWTGQPHVTALALARLGRRETRCWSRALLATTACPPRRWRRSSSAPKACRCSSRN
jgi:predicted ATPase